MDNGTLITYSANDHLKYVFILTRESRRKRGDFSSRFLRNLRFFLGSFLLLDAILGAIKSCTQLNNTFCSGPKGHHIVAVGNAHGR